MILKRELACLKRLNFIPLQLESFTAAVAYVARDGSLELPPATWETSGFSPEQLKLWALLGGGLEGTMNLEMGVLRCLLTLFAPQNERI